MKIYLKYPPSFANGIEGRERARLETSFSNVLRIRTDLQKRIRKSSWDCFELTFVDVSSRIWRLQSA